MLLSDSCVSFILGFNLGFIWLFECGRKERKCLKKVSFVKHSVHFLQSLLFFWVGIIELGHGALYFNAVIIWYSN